MLGESQITKIKRSFSIGGYSRANIQITEAPGRNSLILYGKRSENTFEYPLLFDSIHTYPFEWIESYSQIAWAFHIPREGHHIAYKYTTPGSILTNLQCHTLVYKDCLNGSALLGTTAKYYGGPGICINSIYNPFFLITVVRNRSNAHIIRYNCYIPYEAYASSDKMAVYIMKNLLPFYATTTIQDKHIRVVIGDDYKEFYTKAEEPRELNTLDSQIQQILLDNKSIVTL